MQWLQKNVFVELTKRQTAMGSKSLDVAIFDTLLLLADTASKKKVERLRSDNFRSKYLAKLAIVDH